MEAIKQFHIKVNEKWALLSIQQLLRAKKSEETIMDKDKDKDWLEFCGRYCCQG